jgi:hypothetical protein
MSKPKSRVLRLWKRLLDYFGLVTNLQMHNALADVISRYQSAYSRQCEAFLETGNELLREREKVARLTGRLKSTGQFIKRLFAKMSEMNLKLVAAKKENDDLILSKYNAKMAMVKLGQVSDSRFDVLEEAQQHVSWALAYFVQGKHGDAKLELEAANEVLAGGRHVK